MIVMILLFAAGVVALAAAAFCAGSETAFLSVRRGRITHLAREGSENARIVEGALKEMNSTLTTLLIGNNLAHVTFSSAAAALGARLVGGSGAWYAAWTALSAFAVLYLSEFLPKLFCSTRPLRRSLALAPAYRWFAKVMTPLTRVAVAVTSVFIPKRGGKGPYKVTMNELRRILADRKEGVRLSDFETALVSRLLEMRRNGEFITVAGLLTALDDDD